MTDRTLDRSPEGQASPEVLRALHNDYVAQRRRSAMIWLAVAGLASATVVVLDVPPGPLLAVLGLMALTAMNAVAAWLNARRDDPFQSAIAQSRAQTQDRQRSYDYALRLSARPAVATMAIGVVLFAVGIVEWLVSGSVPRAVARAGLVKFLVSEGEWWRLLTATFLHAGGLHLANNVFALWVFGRIVEASVPRAWVPVTFLTAGLCGSLASWWLRPEATSLGASGAVLGVGGFALVLTVRRSTEFPQAIRQQAWMIMLATAFIGAIVPGVDNSAHAGGAVAGAAIALFALRRPSQSQTRRTGLSLAGVACGLVLIAAAVQTVIALTNDFSTLASTNASAARSGPPVTSVSADLVRNGSLWYIVVANNGPSVLEAFQVDLDGGRANIWRDDCCVRSVDHGPIPPGGVARLPYLTTFNFRRGTAATVTVAVFEDGTFEGSPDLRDRIERRRREALVEAAFWLDVFNRAPDGPPAEVARYLERHTFIRARWSETAAAALQAFGIPMLLELAEKPPPEFTAEVQRTRARIAEAREALRARLNAR